MKGWPRNKKQMALYFEHDQYKKMLELKNKHGVNLAAWVRDLVTTGIKEFHNKLDKPKLKSKQQTLADLIAKKKSK